MLLKNFGVTRHGRVVFDYDELLLVDSFRRIPPPRDEMESLGLTLVFGGTERYLPRGVPLVSRVTRARAASTHNMPTSMMPTSGSVSRIKSVTVSSRLLPLSA